MVVNLQFPGSSLAPPRAGMGYLGSATSIAAVAGQGAAATGSIVAALGAFFAGPGTALAAAGPIGAAIAGVVAIGLAIASQFKGCGATCTEATQIANQIEPILNQNLTNYLNAPIHYASMQAAALNNFDTAWSALEQACGNLQLSTAGQNCISERQQGACSYKTSGQGWVQDSSGNWSYQASSGGNGSGNVCWNWFVGYRDPIANDPTVVPDPSSLSDVINTTGDIATTATSAISDIASNPLALIGGLALIAALLL